MRSIILILLGLMLANPTFAAELYRWVDDQGRVHYSDRPAEGAETVEVKPAQSYAAPTRPAVARPAPAREAPAEPQARYQSMRIVNPGSEQVLWNLGGVLTVNVDVKPALRDDDRIVVRYNGQPVDWPGRASSHQLQEVHRGTHTVSATVVDATGAVLVSAQPVTFHVKQSSVLN